MITKEEALKEDYFHLGECTDKHHEIWERCHDTRLSAKHPEEFSLVVKYHVPGRAHAHYTTITEDDAVNWHTIRTCGLQRKEADDAED